MKIAFLTYSTKPRGSVIHTLELATALTELGHQVCVFALDKDGSGFDQQLPFTVRLVPAQTAPAEINALIQQRIREFVEFLAAESTNFDIYHAQDCIGANALLELRQRGLIRHFVRTIHHIEDFQSPYLKQCQDKSIRQPDLGLCVSDGWQQVLRESYRLVVPRVFNGVNLHRFSATPSGQEETLKACYGLSGSPIYLTVGGIEPRKNSIGLLQAFALVLKTHPQAQLIIAGGATLFDYQAYRDEFFAIAQSLSIMMGQSLILPGGVPTEDLPALYRCANAFCFPSSKEGWGLVVMEAIASGLPTIVSEQSPFTEFLGPDQALWGRPNDPESIAAAMVKAVNEDMTALVNSSQQILHRYSWRRSAQLHEHYYSLLLAP